MPRSRRSNRFCANSLDATTHCASRQEPITLASRSRQLASVTSIFVGIDVACARLKRPPICVAGLHGGRLEPLELPPELARALPLGLGNIEILQDAPFRRAAAMLAGTLDRGAKEHNWEITRVAVDAPAAPPATGERVAEKALRQLGLILSDA